MESYLLIEASSGNVWRVLDNILKIEGIKMAHVVTGNFDVIAFAEFSNIDELTSLIQKVQTVPDVLKTQTAVAMKQELS
ncbi:MAG: Lrp/AsnC ligand binding domain-containing protein [Candidatus Bathyarchaeota archaeon]